MVSGPPIHFSFELFIIVQEMQLVGHAYIIDYIVFYAVSAICHAYTKESM